MLVTCAEMKALEARAFADGVSAEALMEEAGVQIARAVQQFVSSPGRCVVHFGKGHNGGDALVAARELAACGWEIETKAAFPRQEWADLTARKFQQLEAARSPRERAGGSGRARPVAVLDGLLGIGASGPLRPPIREAAQAINEIRAGSNARVFAIDLPSGLDGDSGAADPDAVVADYTLTIGCAKTGLLADDAARHTGRLAVLPLRELSARLPTQETAMLATPETLRPLLRRRGFDTHKGECGRVGIVAGSRGLTGAAILAAEACVHAGAGLVSLFVPADIYQVVAAAVSPEVMVKPGSSHLDVLETKYDVLALGPGLGPERRAESLELIRRAEQPMIIDADGLNILATQVDVLEQCAGPRLLTPHPGEMQRLDSQMPSRSRRETVEAFLERHPRAVLLLKGARTIVGERGRPLSYNTTGSPGMATGGMGDVLTGVCAALVGQGLSLFDAARLGAWLCGRAAECALGDAQSEESLSATHVIAHLGRAFHELRAGCY